MKEIFEEKYKGLNEAQKRAVDMIEGPVMVVAGPGTGKTQILTLRIANILLRTDINPENILAITFTEAGASAMRSRLVDIIGGEAYKVQIFTFHGFCNYVIKEYPDEFPHIIGARNSTEVEVAQIIEELLQDGQYKELRPFGDTFFYVKSIISSIASIKREGLTPEEFSSIVLNEKEKFSNISDLFHTKGPHAGKMKGDYQTLEKQIKKQEELVRIYKEYQEIQRKKNLYDFEDMILEVLSAFRGNKNLLQVVQEKFLYVLVDEHQDTNNGQNKVLELLMNYYENPNIFIVGDEKQAIFRFQGASLENFLYFKEQYPTAELIVLENNYRSTQTILDAAHTVLKGKARLLARAGHEELKIRLGIADTQTDELAWIAKDIAQKIDSGISSSDIAVLYRDNKDAERIVEILERYGIPTHVYTEGNALRDNDVQKLLLILKSVQEVGNDELLAQMLHIDFLGLDPIDIYKCLSQKSSLALVDKIRSREFLKDVGIKDISSFLNLGRLLSTWKTLSVNRRLSEFFEIVMRESGFFDSIMKGEDAIQKLSALESVFEEIKNCENAHTSYSLENFLSYIDTIEEHNIRVKTTVVRPVFNEVHCMTAHKSKGLEFSFVYIVHAHDGHWGNRRTKNLLKLPDAIYLRSQSMIEGTDDERRLFYVALTRAKKEVIISYATHDVSGGDVLQSQFVSEIKEELISKFQIEKSDISITRIKNTKRKTLKDENLVRHLFSERGFSATALNNYLDCPWRYFYSNLLRIPSAMTKFQIYGNVVHSTLEEFFSRFKVGNPGREFLLEQFKLYMDGANIKNEEREEMMQKGTKALTGYYEKYHTIWTSNIQTEVPFHGILLTPDIRLTGKIDKIEVLNKNNDVNVVDYKTEKPKSRNEIEGKTKNSKGNIKRQLTFYKLLLDLYSGVEKFHFVSGQIDFIEPDEKGIYHSEQFIIEDKETEELKKEIVRVVNEIQTLAFWDARCDDKECRYCALRELL